MQAEPASEGAPGKQGSSLAGLGLRIASGVTLGAAALGALYAGGKIFAALVLAVSLAMAWEWGRMVRGREWDLTFFVHAAGVAVAIALASMGLVALGFAALVIAAIIVIPLQFGDRLILSAAGVFYVGLPALSLLWLRDAQSHGLEAVLFVLIAVWATDIMAYLSGRMIGGPKLWPAVSPNKTWSGLTGGMLAAAAAGALIALYIGSDPLRLAVSGLAVGLVAQAGDLAESALKRHFGVKDASNLIPGHGGFMDRMDGVVTASVAAAVVALFASPQSPAHALLFGQ